MTKEDLSNSPSLNHGSVPLWLQAKSFKKAEKLKSELVISELFSSGKSFVLSPLRIIYKSVPLKTDFPIQIGVTSSSRRGKKFNAPQRNRIKRVLREQWRLNKDKIYSHLYQNNQQMAIMMIFSSKKMQEDLKKVPELMPKVIEKLISITTNVKQDSQ